METVVEISWTEYNKSDENTVIFKGYGGFVLNMSLNAWGLTLTEERPNTNSYCGVGVTLDGMYWKGGNFLTVRKNSLFVSVINELL